MIEVFLPAHRRAERAAKPEDALELFYDVIEEVAELHIAERDSLRRGFRGTEMGDEVIKETVDVILTAYSLLSAITDNPNAAIANVIADNIRRGKYTDDMIEKIYEHDRSWHCVVERIKPLLEKYRESGR